MRQYPVALKSEDGDDVHLFPYQLASAMAFATGFGASTITMTSSAEAEFAAESDELKRLNHSAEWAAPRSAATQRKVTRALLFVVPEPVFASWKAVIEKNEGVLRDYFGDTRLSFFFAERGTKKAVFTKILDDHSGPGASDRALIALVRYSDGTGNFSEILKRFPEYAFLACLMDELPQQVKSLTQGDEPPALYRAIGVSATPNEVFDCLLYTSTKNYMRVSSGITDTLTKTDRGKTWQGNFTDAFLSRTKEAARLFTQMCNLTYTFLTADRLIGHRLPVALLAAQSMPRAIGVYNANIANRFLYPRERVDEYLTTKPLKKELRSYPRDRLNEKAYVTFRDIVLETTRLVDRLTREVDDPNTSKYTMIAQQQTATRFMKQLEERRARCTCVRCEGPLSEETSSIATCCCTPHCAACTGAPCAHCNPSEHNILGATFEERVLAIVQSTYLTPALAFRELLRAARAFGKNHVLVVSSTCTMAALQSAAEYAADQPWVRGLLDANGNPLDEDMRKTILRSYRDTQSDAFRVLSLYNGSGQLDQTTGLDLGVTDVVISIGTVRNPQQTFSRAVRASPDTRAHDVDIIRITPPQTAL